MNLTDFIKQQNEKQVYVAEWVYRDNLARQLRGQTEVRTPVGYIDVLTKKEIIEVKHARDWKSALGQIMAYAYYYPDRKKRIHFIGTPIPEAIYICNFLKVGVTSQKPIHMTAKQLEEVASYQVESRRFSKTGISGYQKNIDQKIAEANAQLKAQGMLTRVRRKQAKLYVRGTFPLKPHHLRNPKFQARKRMQMDHAINQPATSDGLTTAIEIAQEMSRKVQFEIFDWSDF